MTELQLIENSIESLKNAFELILNSKEENKEQFAQLFADSEQELERLLPKIAKYKIQLNKPEDERFFGPNTMKRICSVIEKYEILFSVYQDELDPLFPNRPPAKPFTLNRSEETAQPDEELRRLIENCRLQTKIESRSNDIQEDTLIELGKNLNDIVINQAQNDIINEIKQINASDKISLLNSSIELLKINNNSQTRNHIIELCEQIYKNPESLQLRVLRIGNTLLQERILTNKGGIQCLLAIGFDLKYGHAIANALGQLMDPNAITNEPYLYLEEPSLDNFDKWEDWRRHIKLSLDMLKSAKF